MLGHFVLSQDLSLKCWDTSHCPTTSHSSIGTLRAVPRPSVGTLRTVPRPLTQVLGHIALSQDYLLKCWDTSYCPKTPHSSVRTLRTVPIPFVLVLGHFPLSRHQELGQSALSQDLPLKRWDTSHCPKTLRLSVGTLRTVPGPLVLVLGNLALSQDLVLGHFVLSQDLSLKCWDTSHCPKTYHSSVGTLRAVPRPNVGTLRTVPRPLTQVLGHFALSHNLPLKCWDTLHCPKTTCSSVGTPRTVPRPLTQALGHFALSQEPPFKCWDNSHCLKTPHSNVGTLRTFPRLPAQVFRLFVLSQDLFFPVLGQSDLFLFGVGTLRSLSPVPPLVL